MINNNDKLLPPTLFLGKFPCYRMNNEHIMARLWVDCFDYQSNTVILAELVLRGRPQPVHNLAS